MKFLPVAININRKKILLIGGGKICLQKITSLLPFTKAITVIAEKISEDVMKTCVKCIQKPYSASDLKRFHIVYACTNNKELNAQIRKDAHEQGLWVNVVDNPSLCDFISPAIYKKRYMAVAVNSDGKHAKQSVAWRDKIKKFLEGN